MAIEVGHDWARKMIQELCDLGHHGGTLMFYVDEQERRDRRIAELEALLADRPEQAPQAHQGAPRCCAHPQFVHKNGFCSMCECGGYFIIGGDTTRPEEPGT